MWEYIIVVYYSDINKTKRIYGIVYGKSEEDALWYLGKYYGDTICRIEYFGFGANDADDCLYELNDDWADDIKISGRRFKKMIPELNDLPSNSNIVE